MGGGSGTGWPPSRRRYRPEGVNLGPTWARRPAPASPATCTCTPCPGGRGDTNFMTAVAGTRVLPETLAVDLAAAADGVAAVSRTERSPAAGIERVGASERLRRVGQRTHERRDESCR